MTMFLAPYTAIADIDGSPLDAGFLFFGEYNKDPELFPVPVYWDADFTVPAAQPIRTRNGYPVRNGSPTKVYLKTAEHSIVIKNRNGAFILVDFKNKGWDASFVVDGNENQHDINNKTVQLINSISDLKNHKPRKVGQVINLKSYIANKNAGGSDLICIQSNVLQDNGVTVFKSNIVGFEDHFWVRINSPIITVEMAGALGYKVFNSYDAFKRCIAIGGDFLLREDGEYLLEGYDSEVGVVMNVTKPTHFSSGVKRASIYFKHTAPTASPNAARIGTDDEPMVGFTLENINVYGHPNRGHANYAERCWGLSFAGVHQGKMKNVKFSTFQGRPFTIGRRQVDWIQSSDLNNANTKAAIDRLLALSSTDFEITNIHQEYCRSAGGAIFGGNRVYVDGVTADLTESLAKIAIWTDDASSQTPLSAYGINHEIHIKNVICPDGIIVLDGTSKGSVRDCTVDKIGYRSYDFGQQKNNFNSIAHTYNTNDFLNMPFLWMDHLDRSIVVTENKVNDIDVRGACTSVYQNIVSSKADNSTLYLESTNAIQWGTGVSYYDHYYTGTTDLKPKLIRSNEFIINHTGITCVGYDSVNTSQFFPVLDSVIHNPKGYAFTHMQYANSRNRKDSYTTIDVSNASKNVNHPINVRQSMLTQGIGYNHMKTLVNVRSGQGAQAIARFRNTTSPVVFRIFIVAANGNCLDKKISIDAAGAATVTNLDALTTWNTGVFGVTVNSDGSKTLTANVGSDASFDIQANGVWGDCIFELTDTRGSTTG